MATEPARKRRTRSDGERSYRAILDAAARLATLEGLEGLSIGRVANEIGMSKSGLFSHFASKQDLQLATIATAEAIYAAEVIEPAMQLPEGLQRLEQLCERYLSYVKRGVFPGGCFFASTAAELDTRGGPIRDRVRAVLAGWDELLEANLRAAQRRRGPRARRRHRSADLRDQRPAPRGKRPLPAVPRHRRARPSANGNRRPTRARTGMNEPIEPSPAGRANLSQG